MNSNLKKLLKSISLQFVAVTILFSGIIFTYALTYHGAPYGEVDGGKFMKYFNLMLVNTGNTTDGKVHHAVYADNVGVAQSLSGDFLCDEGQVLRGINPDGTKSCVIQESSPILTTYYPGCSAPDIVLSNGQIWAACNVGSSVSGIGISSYGTYHTFSQGLSICEPGYRLPSRGEFDLAFSAYPKQNLGDLKNLATKLVMPLVFGSGGTIPKLNWFS